MPRLFLVFAALVTAAPAAVAHPVHGSMPGQPFRLIDRPDPHNAIGLDFAIGGLVFDDNPEEVLLLRLEPHARLTLNPNAGLFAALPISILMILDDGGTNDDGQIGLGNFDVGGFYVAPLSGWETTLVLRGSLTLPTASDDPDRFVANLVSAELNRLTDVILTLPELVAFRGAVSLIHDSPGATIRLDAGLDVPLTTTVDGVDVDHSPVIRLNAGAAIGDTTRFIVELASIGNEDSFGNEGEFLQQLGLGVTTQSGHVLLGASFGLLLDSVIEDDVDGALVSLILTAVSKF